MGFIFILESGNIHHVKEMSEFSNWQLFQGVPSCISIKMEALNLIIIPRRRSAASRPTVYLVLQPSRVKLWPFSGGQVVKRRIGEAKTAFHSTSLWRHFWRVSGRTRHLLRVDIYLLFILRLPPCECTYRLIFTLINWFIHPILASSPLLAAFALR